MKLDIDTLLQRVRTQPSQTAYVQEAACIGCTKCIQACPVDAIVGSAKHMHTILPDHCIGCGLCVEPCPVDCIELHPQPTPHVPDLEITQRVESTQQRLLRARQHAEALYQQQRLLAASSVDALTQKMTKKNYIMQAMERRKAALESLT